MTMPTARDEALKIAGRARRLGWPVVQSDGGSDWLYRITCPDGFRVQLHSSPSDRNWIKAVMKQLNDHGFEEAEEAWKIKDEENRQAILAEDRRKNAAALQAAQTRASAMSRAAGPYGPQVATVDWIFTKHEVPETRRVLVTPELAAKILEELNTNNRPLRSTRVTYWTTLIAKGHWRYTHQGIAFDTRGALQDGQHRLAAAVQEGHTLDINVSVGMPVDNFAFVDTGTTRSGGDTLAVAGKDNSNTLAAATKLLAIFNKH